MTKNSLIQREKKRQKLEKRYSFIRQSLKKELRRVYSLRERWNLNKKLKSLPRNSASTRLRRRCFLTGRPRAYFKYFGLSGHKLREKVNTCVLPGIKLSSW